MTDETTEPITVEGVLERIAQARLRLDATLAGLSEAQWTTPDPQERWAVKDHLTHLAVWTDGITALLQKGDRPTAMGLSSEDWNSHDYDVMNDVIYRRYRDASIDAVRAQLDESEQRFAAVLRSLHDDDLQRGYSFYQPSETGENSGAPIIGWIAGNTFEHYDEHRPWIEATLVRVG
jgi:hypothetical protein